MKLSIITPESTLFSGNADMVTCPGAEGEFGVLAGHAPLVATLKAGTIIVQNGSGEQRFSVEGGVAEITPEKCVILSESARAA